MDNRLLAHPLQQRHVALIEHHEGQGVCVSSTESVVDATLCLPSVISIAMASVSSSSSALDDNSEPKKGLARKLTCSVDSIGERERGRAGDEEEGHSSEPVHVYVNQQLLHIIYLLPR